MPLNGALDQVRPSGIRRFSRLAAETPGCISLTLGEPGEDTPGAIVSRVQEDLDARMTHYPPNNGHAFLREGIARDCVRRGLSY
ncbi:MAG: aminotransferase, partial [Slackia sp.]|nr:aminotransferase [Slackia sp.]